MRKIICFLLFAFSSASLSLAWAAAPEIADDAPDRHVVKPGDTLWGIAGLFLKEPWRWPEVWKLNREQIRNPHLIYPGQIVYLENFGGDPRLRVARPVKLEPKTYETRLKEPISSIPHQAIEPFLSKPVVVEAGFNESAPKVVATQEGRVYLGPGDLAYVVGAAQPAKMWYAYRPAAPIKDPRTKELIGYEAEYLGELRQLREGEDGQPATFEVVSSRLEIGKGDRLMPAPASDIISYAPHAPEKDIDGNVVRILGGVAVSGKHSAIMINRGARHGVEIGHVLAMSTAGKAVGYREGQSVTPYQLPDERAGLAFVFRVFDGISYALVMEARRPITVGDRVRKP